jgi:hypothetical protein
MISEINSSIKTIWKEYEKDEYIKDKFYKYMTQHLPGIVANWKQEQQKRMNRAGELSKEHEKFVDYFLRRYQYYYIPNNEQYFLYNGRHYQHTKEDNIIQNIATTIDHEKPQLISWKQKTKVSILKRIKEKNLNTSIPESDTIQIVLNSLYPVFFSNRNEAKYFLCIIGDTILKKNNHTNNIHFIDAKAKSFLRELEYFSNFYLSSNSTSSFKHKFHEHSYEHSRILSILPTIQNEDLWKPILRDTVLDILCVSCHYSNRYGTSDEYLNKLTTDFAIKQRILYLQNTTPSEIVSSFHNEYLEHDEGNATHISWKDIQYLWRDYLQDKMLPNVMFIQTMKQELITLLGDEQYNNEKDHFIGITSRQLPSVKNFLSFWNQTMNENTEDAYLEKDELLYLYNEWSKENGGVLLNSDRIVELIQYYFPNVDWEQNKYIHGWSNRLWDKQLDVQIAMDSLRNNRGELDDLSVYDAYEYYCKYHKELSPKPMLVNKCYFEHVWRQ